MYTDNDQDSILQIRTGDRADGGPARMCPIALGYIGSFGNLMAGSPPMCRWPNKGDASEQAAMNETANLIGSQGRRGSLSNLWLGRWMRAFLLFSGNLANVHSLCNPRFDQVSYISRLAIGSEWQPWRSIASRGDMTWRSHMVDWIISLSHRIIENRFMSRTFGAWIDSD